MESYSDYIIDIRQLKKNVDNIRNVVGNHIKFCAVVKANAYGLGHEDICKSLKGKVDFFAVANLKEALNIRKIDDTTPILILGVVDSAHYYKCVENNISVSIGNISQLVDMPNLNNKLKIHIQINSGLNRFGFRLISDFKKAVNLINKNPNLILEGMYSHFATKGNDTLFIKRQFFKFIQFKKYVNNNDVIFHIANSYATICEKKYHQSMVRSGFLMYGEMENNICNKPILTIKSKLVNILSVKRGDTIGYDRSFVVKKSMKIGIVPIGYADGFDRRLSNNFSVLVGGKYCKVVGMVCMDVFMVNITDINANLFDEVVILGNQKDKTISLNDYAEMLKTSPYEILLKFNYKRMNYIIKK